MHQSNHVYHHDNQALQGYLTYDNTSTFKKRPAVLVVHDWSGRNAFACEKADAFAEMGYVGFAVDMYGDGRVGDTIAEKQALMQPFMDNRVFLQARIQAAFNAVATMPEVDPLRIAVVGFCFGGLCALDLARSGAPVACVVSFHGLLHQAASIKNQPIHADILVLHGYDDPMIPAAAVQAFCEEMTAASVDWQVHAYSQTRHAFMNPAAHDASLGTVYQPRTARRAWHVMEQFLIEQFE